MRRTDTRRAGQQDVRRNRAQPGRTGVSSMARVSVIDDSPQFLDLMDELLTGLGHRMTGFQAVEASIESIVQSRPELLIVDLRLRDKPLEISGWELVVLARSHRHLISTPVILCTADVWELERRASDLEQIRGVHVRTKPFDVEEMCRLIQRLLRTPVIKPATAATTSAPSSRRRSLVPGTRTA